MSIMWVLLFLSVALCQSPEQQKAYKVQQREMETRDAVNLRYNENTETLTFVVGQMADFMIKPDYDEEVKATLHVYWRQHNVYISSEYREGEHIQIVVYEDNYRIVHNENFYVTHGLKFTGEKGKTYTIRFVSGGKVEKLLAMEISQTTTKLENVASQNHLDNFNQRAQQVSLEIKTLLAVEERNIILHQRASAEVNHSSCIYMSYLMGQAALILVLVVLELRWLTKLLRSESIV